MRELRAGRPEAAAVIWTGRAEAASPPAKRGAKGPHARLRGLLQGGVGIAFGALLVWLGHPRIGTVAASLGALVAVAALVSPTGLFAAIESGFATLGAWTGRALTWLLMPAIFYGFFMPFGLLFRRGRRDAMRGFYESEAPTYWSQRDERRSGSSSRHRQY